MDLDSDQDPAVFVINLQCANKKLIYKKKFSAYYFFKVQLHHFFKEKVQKKSQKVGLMMEGPGSGSIPLTNGSESGTLESRRRKLPDQPLWMDRMSVKSSTERMIRRAGSTEKKRSRRTPSTEKRIKRRSPSTEKRAKRAPSAEKKTFERTLSMKKKRARRTPSTEKKRTDRQCSGSMTFWCGSGSADPCL
jgi:hypothetical protein